MSKNQWDQVTELFQAALERTADERDAFLEERCGNDMKLRQTVAALLAADEEAGEFMESPLTEATFDSLELNVQSSAPGRRDD